MAAHNSTAESLPLDPSWTLPHVSLPSADPILYLPL